MYGMWACRNHVSYDYTYISSLVGRPVTNQRDLTEHPTISLTIMYSFMLFQLLTRFKRPFASVV